MTIDFEILQGRICVTPCPFGKSAMVFSASCKACKHYAGRAPRQWPINCNYELDRRMGKSINPTIR